MNRFVFWDTSAFIALGVERDSWQKQAIAVSKQLTQSGARILTSTAVLSEVANGLSRVNARPVAVNLINATKLSAEQGVAKIVHVSPALWARGWELYQARMDKEWGLVDCMSMILMRDYGVSEVFTADHHFAQAGFECLLK